MSKFLVPLEVLRSMAEIDIIEDVLTDQRVCMACGAAAPIIWEAGKIKPDEELLNLKHSKDCPREFARKLLEAGPSESEQRVSGLSSLFSAAYVKSEIIGLYKAAAILKTKADDYAYHYASSDLETNETIFEYGESGRDYHSTLLELSDLFTQQASSLEDGVRI